VYNFIGGKPMTNNNEGKKTGNNSPERKRRQSEFMRGNKYHLGFKHSEETRKKISNALVGKHEGWHHTKETKIKMSRSHTGAMHTEDEKIRIRASCTKNGKHDKMGYFFIKSREHPYKNSQGYMAKHRLVMEAHLGRILLPTEVVHHINGEPSDNRIENLMLFSCSGEHIRHHGRIRKAISQRIRGK
jgi:hypothetical protein